MGWLVAAYVVLFLGAVFISSPDGQRLINSAVDWIVEMLGGGNGEA